MFFGIQCICRAREWDETGGMVRPVQNTVSRLHSTLPTRCIYDNIYEAGIVITRVWICVCVLSVYLSICKTTQERGDGCCPAWYTWARLQLALKKCANQNLFSIWSVKYTVKSSNNYNSLRKKIRNYSNTLRRVISISIRKLSLSTTNWIKPTTRQQQTAFPAWRRKHWEGAGSRAQSARQPTNAPISLWDLTWNCVAERELLAIAKFLV